MPSLPLPVHLQAWEVSIFLSAGVNGRRTARCVCCGRRLCSRPASQLNRLPTLYSGHNSDGNVASIALFRSLSHSLDVVSCLQLWKQRIYGCSISRLNCCCFGTNSHSFFRLWNRLTFTEKRYQVGYQGGQIPLCSLPERSRFQCALLSLLWLAF